MGNFTKNITLYVFFLGVYVIKSLYIQHFIVTYTLNRDSSGKSNRSKVILRRCG